MQDSKEAQQDWAEFCVNEGCGFRTWILPIQKGLPLNAALEIESGGNSL